VGAKPPAASASSDAPLPPSGGRRTVVDASSSPHLAGLTREAEQAMGLLAVDTLAALLRGERPPQVVNPEVFSNPSPGDTP